MLKIVLASVLAATLSYTPPGNLHGYWMYIGAQYYDDAKHILEAPSVWAVAHLENGYTLAPVSLSVEHIQHKGADGKVTFEEDMLRFSGGIHPHLLIGGLKDPQPGPLEVAAVDPVYLVPGVRLDLSLPGDRDKLTLRVKGVPDRGQKQTPEIHAQFAIVIEREGEPSQVLDSDFFPGRDQYVRLGWAGDIDRDGRIDLMLDYGYKEIGSAYILMLSSERRLNQLLCPVARFINSC